MKRSTSVRLALLGSVPFALAACDGEPVPTRTLSQTTHYLSKEDCMLRGVPADICIEADFDVSERDQTVAPRYFYLQQCENDFAPDGCVPALNFPGYGPKLSGFALTTERQVPLRPEDQEPPAGDTAGTSTSSSGSTGSSGSWGRSIARWVGLGDPEPPPRYFSEPLYQERSDSRKPRLVTLNQLAASGTAFHTSINGGASVARTEHASSSHFAGAEAHELVSRGGFGSSRSRSSSWGFSS